MRKIQEKTIQEKNRIPKNSRALANNGLLHQLAFDNSPQANIVFTVSSGKIIMANHAACKLLGYSGKEILSKSWADIFEIKLKDKLTGVLTAIKKNSKSFPCQIISAVFLNTNGIKKSITTLTDISERILRQEVIDTKKDKVVAGNIALAKTKQKKIDSKNEKIVAENIALVKTKQKGIDNKKRKTVAKNIFIAKSRQKKIDSKNEKIVAHDTKLALAKSDDEKTEQEIITKAEREESFRLIFNSSSDVLFDSDLRTNKVTLSDAYENKFGHKIINNITHAEDWVSHIHPEDREAVMENYKAVLASTDTEWKCNYRVLRADNSIAKVLSSRIILRDADGKAYRMIGSIHDTGIQKVLEERLAQEIRLKEKQIAEAEVDAKEAERSEIGKELHDNVNQLLGISKMYLDMAKQGGENSEMYLSRSTEYTITAIEAIRKLTKGLTTDTIRNLGLCEAIENVTRDTMEVNPVKISCKLNHTIEKSMNDKFKMNVFRIVQEQLNNILKHAKANEIAIWLLQNKKSIVLSISDNGVGFDIGIQQEGIGVANIKNRAKSYNGTADFISEPGKGCILTVTFPVTDTLRATAAA